MNNTLALIYNKDNKLEKRTCKKCGEKTDNLMIHYIKNHPEKLCNDRTYKIPKFYAVDLSNICQYYGDLFDDWYSPERIRWWDKRSIEIMEHFIPHKKDIWGADYLKWKLTDNKIGEKLTRDELKELHEKRKKENNDKL